MLPKVLMAFYAVDRWRKCLVRVHSLEEVDNTEYQECDSAAESDYALVSKEPREQINTEQDLNLPTRMLTFPAIALPPMTAAPVQSPWPTTAPAVTHQ